MAGGQAGTGLGHLGARCGRDDVPGKGGPPEHDRPARRPVDRVLAVVDASRDAFVEVDAHGAITNWNRRATELFGWEPVDALGRDVLELLVPRRHRPVFEREMAQRTQGARRSGSETIEPSPVVIADRDGNELPLVLRGYVTVDDDSGPRFGVFLHDRSAGDSEEVMARALLHDALTGLPNRTLFSYRLQLALDQRLFVHEASSAPEMVDSSGTPVDDQVVVATVDLARLPAINDALGHDTGDAVVRAVGDRLARLRPLPVVIARDAGQFLALFVGPDATARAWRFADAVHAALAGPFACGAADLPLDAAVGIATAAESMRSASAVLSASAAAMRDALSLGAGTRAFGETLRLQIVERLETERALRHALAEDQFRLVYQPIVDLPAVTTSSVEALLRWDRPDEGVVGPNSFIEVAEESGLVIPLGAWVLADGCRRLGLWRASHWPGARLSLNMSARQFEEPGVVALVERVLSQSGVPPSALTLEITETVLMRDHAGSQKVLGDLKDLGVLLALDDFGSGYSSLGYLRSFPFDFLKVDRSFVAAIGTDPQCEAIVAAVVGLGHALGLRVVAEGVEREAQLQFLIAQGCDEAQGFLISRPVDADQVEPRTLSLVGRPGA